MKRRIAFVLAVLLMVLACGCSNKEASEKSSGDSEIVVWTFLNPADESGRGKVLANLIEKYESTYPNVKVVVESMQWDTISARFLAAHETGTGPDVIFCESTSFGAALRAAAMTPLEDLFLSEWSEEEIADINDSRFQMGATENEHYQVMMFANPSGIIYRTDILEENNIDPNSLNSWDAILEAAQKMTYVNDDGEQIYGLGIGLSENRADSSVLIADVLCRYGSALDMDGNVVWENSTYSEKALQLQVDMIEKYSVMPESVLTSTSDDMYTDFAAGKYAMIFGGAVRFGNIQSQCVFNPEDFAIIPYPSEDGYKYSSYVPGWNVGIWSGSNHKEEAGRFIEMMISPEFDEQWVVEGSQLPLRLSTMDSLEDYFTDPLKAFIPDAMEILKNAVSDDVVHDVSGYRILLNRAVQYVIGDGYSVQDALKKTAAEFKSDIGI